MAWIESHQSLGAHPKTKKLARLLNVPLPQVVGHLHMLWWWAFDYAQDGDLSRYAAEDIADAVLWEGSASLLMASLLDAGFLDQPNGKPCIHDWDEYGGKLLAKRRADAQRKENARNSEPVQRTSNGHPTDILRTAQVEERRGEDIEEKREEKSAPTRLRAPGARKPAFQELTDDERKKLIVKWTSKIPNIEDVIALSLEHENHWKYPTGQFRYVDNWCRREWQSLERYGATRPPPRVITFDDDLPLPEGMALPEVRFQR